MTSTSEQAGQLRGISQIRGFLRTNQQPVYFVSPTAFNLLGIDRWVRSFFYVNWMDSFDGNHPRVFVPSDRAGPCPDSDSGHVSGDTAAASGGGSGRRPHAAV